MPFSITRKIYSSRLVSEFNFVLKKKIQNREKEERERDAHQQVSLNVQLKTFRTFFSLSAKSDETKLETRNPTEVRGEGEGIDKPVECIWIAWNSELHPNKNVGQICF